MSVRQTADGGYILAGERNYGVTSDIWLVKVDTNGDSMWSQLYGGGGTDFCRDVLQARDGGYVLGGGTDAERPDQSYDVWLIKTEPELTAVEAPVAQNFQMLEIYPNPFNAETTIELSVVPRGNSVDLRIFDVTGRLVFERQVAPSSGIVKLHYDGTSSNGMPLSTGLYFLRVQQGNLSKTIKILLLR